MSHQEISILHASRSDFDRMSRLFRETILHTCRNDYTPEQLKVWASSPERRKESWLKRIDEQYFILAESGDELLGMGSLEDDDYIDFLYVSNRHLRKGIAKALYNSLEQKALDLGVKSLKSDVSKTARPFFEKQGFKVVHENQNHIEGEILINFRMEKVI